MLRETPHVPPFSSLLAGHAIASVVIVFVLGVALLLSNWLFLDTSRLSFGEVASITLLAVVLFETVNVVVFRIVSWVRQHYQPGSWLLVCTYSLTPLAGAYAAAVVWGHSPPIPVFAAGTALIFVVPFLLYMDQPWKDGITKAEMFEKVEETRALRKKVLRGNHDTGWMKKLKERDNPGSSRH